jgi:membrane protease YdiL (CAAX protease family)
VTTPPEEASRLTFAEGARGDGDDARTADDVRAVDPDDPPWGAMTGFLVWGGSMLMMLFLPLVLVIPYVIYRVSGAGLANVDEVMRNDPTTLLIGIAATIPTHFATLFLVWAVVTNFGRRPFRETIGWGWSPRFGPWLSVLAAFLLLGAAMLVATLLGVKRTPFDEMLKSSTAALFTTAFLATATAPLVEELVYRGVLFPAVRRATNHAVALILVTVLFAGVHVMQYHNSPGTIAAIFLLSLALTYVRAATGRILPCIVIHFIFNGVQVAGLIYEYFWPTSLGGPGAPERAALGGLLRLTFLN